MADPSDRRRRRGPVHRAETVAAGRRRIRELDAALAEVGPENLQGVHDERNLYETIRNSRAGIVDVLADMNALTSDHHRDTEFTQLHRALDAALAQ